jgi:hypothetical protein
MTSRRPYAAAAVTFLILAPLVACAATPKQIDQAISKSKQYLYDQQQKDGSWELVPKAEPVPPKSELPIKQSPRAGQWGGRTAIAIYALLAAGEKPQDPRLVKAIEFLKHAESSGVYALGLRCLVWSLLPDAPDVRNRLKSDARKLLTMVKEKEGGAGTRGMYDYVDTPKSQEYSHSRSQYAVLGVWAAQQTGVVEVPTSFWKLVEESWTRNQESDGGWTYAWHSTSYPTTPGMTAAALATLYEAQDALAATRGLKCTGNVETPAIAKGLAWLAANGDKIGTTKRYKRDFPYATLYAFERVGVAGGYKRFGDVDWFEKGSDWLIKTQKSEGDWPGKTAEGAPAEKWLPGVPDAAFALLFLARGRSPVVMNKLQYSITPEKAEPRVANWNQRPRDVANAVRWIGRVSERHLNWQIVNLKSGAEDDLNDAPILYVSGNEILSFTADERTKLRRFVEDGGLIYGNADCGSREFAASFRKLGSTLFPGYEFRVLPMDHPVYRNEVFDASKWKTQPGWLGLTNGVREFMILAPDADPSKVWTTPTALKPEPLQAAANLYYYATDKRGLERGQTHVVKSDPKVVATKTVSIARLQYPGNWDPEPGGWRRLSAILHNRRKIDVKVETVKLGDGKTVTDFKLAHLTGTGAAKLGEKSLAELKRFIESGGTLIIDAAGGSSAFAAEVEKAILPALGGSPHTLAANHPLFTAGGEPRPAVRYRDFARKIVGNSSVPRLQAIEVKDRVAVIYSREDVSAGLVGEGVDGIIGYEPATATELMIRIVLNAAGERGVPPSTNTGDGLE